MADVEQTKKIIPLITREITFGQKCLRGDVSYQSIESEFWNQELILSNNQSKATLWVLNTCLSVGLQPFIIILITASLSFKDIQHSIGTRMCHT